MQHAGKRVKCPACQVISTVPAPEPEPEFEIIEEAPRPVARPVVRAVADEGEQVATYGLSKGGSARGGEEDEGPRDKPLPDFRLGSGQRGKKRKKK